MADPPNALNIIIKRICQQFRHHPIPSQRLRPKILDTMHAASGPEESGPSSLLGKAWLQIFSNTSETSAAAATKSVRAAGSMAGAIRTRGSSWHPFSFKGGLLDIGKDEDFQAGHNLPDVDLD